MRNITLQDIANQLQISRITVSKVINDKPGVSLETKKKVLQKLLENGYDKLSDEQIRFANESHEESDKCIAVVTIAPDFSEFWLKIINSITKALTNTGYDFIYSILVENDENKYPLPKIIDPRHVSGIIVINVYDEAVIGNLLETKIPTVFLDTTPNMYRKHNGSDLLLLDGVNSIYQITEHMIKSGLTEFGFIGDITYSKTILDRWKGFEAALNNNHLQANPNYCFTQSPYGHFYYMEEIAGALKDMTAMPQAFVCANDYIAFLLIDYLKSRGYRVPDDIAVSGYDNIREKITVESQLTTVCVDTEILGVRLVKQIFMRIEMPHLPSEIIYIQPKVVYRKSTEKRT
ncbi:MAG TPA: substrate-binding domain-containing protein [Caproiciproducens sp.]|nr:substrate-binding domain-containing protein [Caproiciproducens sp.]